MCEEGRKREENEGEKRKVGEKLGLGTVATYQVSLFDWTKCPQEKNSVMLKIATFVQMNKKLSSGESLPLRMSENLHYRYPIKNPKQDRTPTITSQMIKYEPSHSEGIKHSSNHPPNAMQIIYKTDATSEKDLKIKKRLENSNSTHAWTVKCMDSTPNNPRVNLNRNPTRYCTEPTRDRGLQISLDVQHLSLRASSNKTNNVNNIPLVELQKP